MQDIIKSDFVHVTEDGLKYFFTPDYCLYIGGIKLRDIRGSDLAYLDWVRTEVSEEYLNSIQFIIEFLSLFLVPNPEVYDLRVTNPLKKLPPNTVKTVFNVFLEKVVRKPMSRDSWLETVYYINGNNYCNLKSYEMIPMTEFLQMISIHNAYMEKLERANKK